MVSRWGFCAAHFFERTSTSGTHDVIHIHFVGLPLAVACHTLYYKVCVFVFLILVGSLPVSTMIQIQLLILMCSLHHACPAPNPRLGGCYGRGLPLQHAAGTGARDGECEEYQMGSKTPSAQAHVSRLHLLTLNVASVCGVTPTGSGAVRCSTLWTLNSCTSQNRVVSHLRTCSDMFVRGR